MQLKRIHIADFASTDVCRKRSYETVPVAVNNGQSETISNRLAGDAVE